MKRINCADMREIVYGTIRHISRDGAVDRVSSWDYVWQTTLMGSLVVLMGWLVVSIGKDGQAGAFRLGCMRSWSQDGCACLSSTCFIGIGLWDWV